MIAWQEIGLETAKLSPKRHQNEEKQYTSVTFLTKFDRGVFILSQLENYREGIVYWDDTTVLSSGGPFG